jgi:hypothetical protein
MKIKYFFFFCIALLFVASNALAIPALKSIEKLRPEGTERTYLINYKEEQVGALVSKFEGATTFEGSKCYRFSENYNLNLTPFDIEYAVTTIGKHYVDKKGRYIGDDMMITVNDQAQRLHLFKKDETLSGYFKRGDSKEDVNRQLPDNIIAFDNNMIDQIEIFLAFHDVNIGDTIYDSIFVPQSQVIAPVKIAVEDFQWTRYGKLFDSAYVCHFIEPNNQIVYFTKSRKVIRVDQKTQDLNIILFESALDRTAPKVSAFTFKDFIRRIPLYVVYLIFGIIFSSYFLQRNYKRFETYLIFILGAMMLFILKETLFPLQKWYGEQYLIPAVEEGRSFYFYAFFTALFSGLFQEAATMVPLLIIYIWKKPRQEYSIALGFFCGIGLGIVMAAYISGTAYQAGGLKIVSVPVFGQIITILFHGIAGAAFGYGLNRGLKYISLIWLATVLIHSVSEYLIAFTQGKVFDMAVYEFIRTLICLVYLLSVYILIKKTGR